MFIVSAVELAPSAAAAAAADHSAAADVEGLGAVTVGVSRARGAKCQRCARRRARCKASRMPGAAQAPGAAARRCWNYSEEVGAAADHPLLCERCVPVMHGMGFALPAQADAAPAAALSAV